MSKIIHKCDRCSGQAHEWHHKFHRHKNRLETYGVYLMDHPLNGAWLCYSCHNQYKAEYHFNEREFIEVHNLFIYCKKRISCFIENCHFFDADKNTEECRNCREYEFDKDWYYSDKAIEGIKENTLIPGSYGYKEW